MTTHDLAVPDESQERQVFCVGFKHDFVHAQRYYFEESDHDEFTHMVLTNIKMTREFLAHWIFAHRNTSSVVCVQKSGSSLKNSKIG